MWCRPSCVPKGWAILAPYTRAGKQQFKAPWPTDGIENECMRMSSRTWQTKPIGSIEVYKKNKFSRFNATQLQKITAFSRRDDGLNHGGKRGQPGQGRQEASVRGGQLPRVEKTCLFLFVFLFVQMSSFLSGVLAPGVGYVLVARRRSTWYGSA